MAWDVASTVRELVGTFHMSWKDEKLSCVLHFASEEVRTGTKNVLAPEKYNTVKVKKLSYSHNRPWRPIGL
jgi:hypothetical protein